jgi:GH25 family lysozyme M1 (1,4-beta-N-acetylmuramidase)
MARARGADFSSFQSEAETRAAIAHGLDFGIVKLTQGLGYVNPLAHRQLQLLTEHGAVTGLYHFANPHEDGARQFDFFEAHARLYPTRLVAVDHEADQHGVTPSDAILRAFIRRAHQRGYKVGRYGSSGVIRRSLGEDWKWVAWWNPQAPPFRWDIWQFTSRGGDWNLFNGNVAALRAFAAKYGGAPRRPAKPRWWIHDPKTSHSFGPYGLVRAGQVFVYQAARHPRSSKYTIQRK